MITDQSAAEFSICRSGVKFLLPL